MPVATLKPNTHMKIRFPVPRSGRITFRVEADRPVSTYVLSPEELQEFYKQDEFDSHGGFTNRRFHEQRVKLDFTGWWYLVILNESAREPVAVHYEVAY